MIEERGDVSVSMPDGSVITEEDKSSLRENALTDLSSNLWKTFYNWIVTINSGELNVSNTYFVLYTNHAVTPGSLVKQFSEARTGILDSCVENALKVLENVQHGHGLYLYKDTIFNQNRETFKIILSRFELIDDRNADDVYPSIRNFLEVKSFIPSNETGWLLNEITGWLQNLIMMRMANKQCACVSRSELESHMQSMLEKIRKRELIDYAISQMPSPDELSRRAGMRPVYIKQLEKIDLDDTKILEAVSDYFKADTNRLEWIEKGLLSESDMVGFEGKLLSYHSNEKTSIRLTHSSLSDVERGQLLLVNCQQRQEKISDRELPDKTVQGSYHVLADEKRLGWHPRWEDLISDDGKGGTDESAR